VFVLNYFVLKKIPEDGIPVPKHVGAYQIPRKTACRVELRHVTWEINLWIPVCVL